MVTQHWYFVPILTQASSNIHHRRIAVWNTLSIYSRASNLQISFCVRHSLLNLKEQGLTKPVEARYVTLCGMFYILISL
jgi:hypothetical protein